MSPSDLDAAQEGRKVCTIRLGIADVTTPEIDLTDGRRRIKIRIKRIDTSKNFGQLGPEEARGEGFQTTEQLRADLRGYYRNLDEGQPMTIIWFELAQPTSTWGRIPGT